MLNTIICIFLITQSIDKQIGNTWEYYDNIGLIPFIGIKGSVQYEKKSSTAYMLIFSGTNKKQNVKLIVEIQKSLKNINFGIYDGPDGDEINLYHLDDNNKIKIHSNGEYTPLFKNSFAFNFNFNIIKNKLYATTNNDIDFLLFHDKKSLKFTFSLTNFTNARKRID